MKGNHTFKFGLDVRRDRFDQFYYFDVNGEFTFDNRGPNAIVPGDGDNYAEFCWDSPMAILRAPVSAKMFAVPQSIRLSRIVGRSSLT